MFLLNFTTELLAASSHWNWFFSPFEGIGYFVLSVFLAILFVLIFTSSFYFSLMNALKRKSSSSESIREYYDDSNGEDDEEDEEDDEDGDSKENSIKIRLHGTILFYGVVGAILTTYIFVFRILHSLRIDATGQKMFIFSPDNITVRIIADALMAAGILGIIWGWTRFFQILLIRNVLVRYKKMIEVVPKVSAFMIFSFLMGCWYFYSNFVIYYVPFLWFFFTFGIIYGIIYFLTLKDFKRRIRMHLTQSVEFEENFSLGTVSIGFGVILTSLIIAMNVILFHKMHGSFLPQSYNIAFLIIIFPVSIYMTPAKIFRQVKMFPRLASLSARVLAMAKFTRKYLILWTLLLTVLGGFLGFGILFEPGLKLPLSNLSKCAVNVDRIGETMDQYMKENKNYLPGSKAWRKGTWLQKVERKPWNFVPTCPSGGVYIYRKWRNEKGRPVFEIYCTCDVHGHGDSPHIRAGVQNHYPKYRRKEGLMTRPPNKEVLIKPDK